MGVCKTDADLRDHAETPVARGLRVRRAALAARRAFGRRPLTRALLNPGPSPYCFSY
ncbi:mannose-1-phosphate guanylyltransferase [Burkholderia pseudomallei 305]|nr:mannose-1-phosphate guanylyltransferase [Burkholderia pseudomallei 305]